MLTRNGWTVVAIAAAAFAAGIVLGYPELLAVGVVLALCLALAGIWLLSRPTLSVRRHIAPDRVTEGDGSAGVLTIENVGRRRCPPVVAIERVGPDHVDIAIPSVAASDSYITTYRLPTERRGFFSVGPLRVSLADPLRLVGLERAYGAESTLWVHPRIHRIGHIPTGRTQELEGPRSISAPHGGVAFHSLREYEPGDDPRLIHWRSTAKVGELMVRHNVVTNEPTLLIILDTSADAYEGDSFEDAVRIAASFVQAGLDVRYPVELRTTAGASGSIDPTGLGRRDTFDKLAAATTSPDDPGLEAFSSFDVTSPGGVAVGVVTGQPPLDRLRRIAGLARRFDMVTLAQLGVPPEIPGAGFAGVLSVKASTSDDFERAWKLRVRS